MNFLQLIHHGMAANIEMSQYPKSESDCGNYINFVRYNRDSGD